MIEYLLSTPDNIELIRDNIAAILTLELQKQKELATEAALPDAADYDVSVHIDKTRPWQLTSNEEIKNPFPLINVLFSESKPVSGGDRTRAIDYTAKYLIDCYGCGNVAEDDGMGTIIFDDDSFANRRALKTARLARNILMSSFYTYLGLRSVVKSREVSEYKIGFPDNMPESAVGVSVCRITLSVTFTETSPQAEGVPYEGMLFKSFDSNGNILIDM
jgi:hypothetical protein